MFDRFQSLADFHTPLIFDESFDSPNLDEVHFGGQFTDGLAAKSGGLLSMSAYEKPTSTDMIDFHKTNGLHDPSVFGTYAPCTPV